MQLGAPSCAGEPVDVGSAGRQRHRRALARRRDGAIGVRRRCPAGRGGRRPGRRRRSVTSGGTSVRQTSIATGQRGGNRQPGGGSRRSGGEPGMTSRSRRSAWMFGKARRSFWVYGWRGVRKTRPTGPSSATRPAYMIITRSQVSAMTERSWVMRISDSPSFSPEVLEELQDLGLDHDVEGGRRLVADDDRRVAGEGHRDHRPLAHPARQLVRIGLARAPRDPDQLEQLAGSLRRGRLRERPGARSSARRSGRPRAGPG